MYLLSLIAFFSAMAYASASQLENSTISSSFAGRPLHSVNKREMLCTFNKGAHFLLLGGIDEGQWVYEHYGKTC